MSEPRSAIIIGGGVGGLTAAMSLAHRGVSVKLFERTGTLGGRCGRITGEGYTFDLGPTILLMPFVLERAFAEVGRRLSDELTLVRCEPNYRITWRDGQTLTLSSQLSTMREQLEALEPGSFSRYLKMLEIGRVRHDVALEHFVGRRFDSPLAYANPATLARALSIGAHKRLYSDVSSHFVSERLRQAFSFQTMYLGVSPYDAPAVFSLLPYTELAVGIYYPKGGLSAVPRALAKVCADEGVTLRTDSPARRIVVEQGRAVGVQLEGGEVHRADVVICNADLTWATQHLLDAPYRRPELLEKRSTASGFMLYLGLKRRHEELLHHNIFLGDDFEGSFERLFERHQLPEDPSFYVNAPVRSDASMAPPGHDALAVLVPVPHQAPGLDWSALSTRLRAHVLARLASHGVEIDQRSIRFERRLTPDDWASGLNLHLGSNFGLAQSLSQIGPLRPKVWDDRVENLFYCGASAQPGTGVPTVMISARLAVEAIFERAKVPAHRPARTLEEEPA